MGKSHLIGPLLIKKKATIEQLLYNKHKHGSRPKDFNNNFDTSRSRPSKDRCAGHKPKVNSVQFFDPYDHINTTNNRNYTNHLLNEHVEHTREEYDE